MIESSKPQRMGMNGLRIYINTVKPETRSGGQVFYSRRGDGPYYRWSYEERLEKWESSRMPSSDLSPRELGIAAWKVIPAALKDRLSEHYLE
jgi:hypothetical protein